MTQTTIRIDMRADTAELFEAIKGRMDATSNGEVVRAALNALARDLAQIRAEFLPPSSQKNLHQPDL